MFPCRACRYEAYMVGGASSRTLLYFASFTMPTISSSALVSKLWPNRRPSGFSRGKYFRAAASLMTTIFVADCVSRSLKPRPAINRIPIVSKKFGATRTRLMLFRSVGFARP